MVGTAYIGTSGWHYRHWAGRFYPDDAATEDFLAFYARHFRTVEINNTFYRLPSVDVLSAWRAATPANFIFACKASRYITHLKKLKDAPQSTQRFFSAVQALGSKLGPVLFQLPPRWRVNVDRLRRFLEVLPKAHRYAFEFRDQSWLCDEIFQVLRQHNAALCLYDLDYRQSPILLTADFTYVRLHGPDGAYRGCYGEKNLNQWAQRIRAWRKDGLDVYCYFDNDEAGYATQNAAQLICLIEDR